MRDRGGGCASRGARSPAPAASGAARAPAVPGVHVAAVPTEIISDPAGDVPIRTATSCGRAPEPTPQATFSVHVKTPIDPRTDLSWRIRPTQIQWFLDTNLDGEADAVAVVNADGAGNLHAVMERFSDQFVYCTGPARYTATHDYLATFPAGCIPGLRHFRWSVIMNYDPGTVQSDVAPEVALAPVLTVGRVGYWMLGADGVVYAFGTAFGVHRVALGAVAMTPKLDGSGFWIVDAAGHVFVRGSASRFGAAPALAFGERITTISATPTGSGYWLFSNRGRVFPYGSATVIRRPRGAATERIDRRVGRDTHRPRLLHDRCRRRCLRVRRRAVPRLDGRSTAEPARRRHRAEPRQRGVLARRFRRRCVRVLGAVPRLDGKHCAQPTGQGLVAYGNGYLMVASDGGVFDFSNRGFLGSLGGVRLSAPIVGIAAFTT